MDANGVTGGLWWDADGLHLIDQTVLPSRYVVLHPTTVEAVAHAIRTLQVRGAPAIGMAAAFGLAIALREGDPKTVEAQEAMLKDAARILSATRPTAVNLAWAIRRVMAAWRNMGDASPALLARRVEAEALAIWREDRELCRRIGQHGKELLASARKVVTHCNAGSLATAGWGTATAPLYALRSEGWAFRVFVDETRPLLQGARLTAWELSRAGIPVTLMTDGSAGVVLRREAIDAVIVGADRITARGDVANKIGTYGLAVLAQAHRIPFFVAAPFSTFDLELWNGEDIPLEQRAASEVTHMAGVRLAPEGIDVLNLAFDVTPADYISGIITDRGILKPPLADAIQKTMGAGAKEL